MNIAEFLMPENVICTCKSGSKKQVLHDIAITAQSPTGLDEHLIFDTLLQRERLGSTGIGHGVAIPHGKYPGLNKICGVFARLVKPIDFDSVDDEPVDLVFALLAPESAGADHLKALSRIARLMRDPANLNKLRGAENTAALYAILTEPVASDAAA